MSKAFPIKDCPGYYITDSGDLYSRLEKFYYRFKKLNPAKRNSDDLFERHKISYQEKSISNATNLLCGCRIENT